MNWIPGIIIATSAFLFMELMARFTHKYVMHGFLWILHKDHHLSDGRKLE
jgi:beta-carotene 3-hydroxylase